MTIAELTRAIESHNRRKAEQQKEKATFDYILADLIGRSVARIHNASNKFPDIAEAYPTIFNTEAIQEKKVQKQDELSALRFRMFANSYNKRFEEVGEKQ